VTCVEKEEWLVNSISIIRVWREVGGKDARQKPKKYFGRISTGPELLLMVDLNDYAYAQSASDGQKKQ